MKDQRNQNNERPPHQAILSSPGQTQTNIPSLSPNQHTWLQKHGLLHNRISSKELHPSRTAKRKRHSLEWRRKYQLLSPQEKQTLQTTGSSLLSSKPRQPQRHQSEETTMDEVFQINIDDSSREKQQREALRKKAPQLAFDCIVAVFMASLGFWLLPSFFSKPILLLSLLTAYLYRKYKSTKRSIRVWSPQPRIQQIKRELVEALSFLDDSQMVTPKRRQIFFSWAIEKAKAKVRQLHQDPSSPIDELRFKEEAELLLMAILERELDSVDKLNRIKARRKRAKSTKPKQRTKRKPKTKTPKKAAKTKTRKDHKNPAHPQIQTGELQTTPNKPRQPNNNEQHLLKAMQQLEEQLTELEPLQNPTTFYQHAVSPTPHAAQQLSAAKQTINKAQQMLDEGQTTEQNIKRLHSLSQRFAKAENHIQKLQRHYKDYTETFEQLEAQPKQQTQWPSWLTSTLLSHPGCTPDELRFLAFKPYIQSQSDEQPTPQQREATHPQPETPYLNL